MLVNFGIETTEETFDSYFFVMNKFTDKLNGSYYVVILGNESKSNIEEFSDVNPGKCINSVRDYFLNRNLVPVDVSVVDILEPYKEFTQYLIDFGY